MKHFMPVLIKFIVSFLILSFLLNPFTEISFLDIILTAALLVTFSYLIGDNTVLPRTNYLFAAVFDFGLSFAMIAFMVYILTNLSTGFLLPSAIAALAVTAFEVFFHIYLVKRVFPDREDKKERKQAKPMQVQTEFSEELEPEVKRKRED